jgi:hypothetical protein
LKFIQQKNDYSCAPVGIYNLRIALGEKLKPKDLKIISERMRTDKDGTSDSFIVAELELIMRDHNVDVGVADLSESLTIKSHLRWGQGLVLMSHLEIGVQNPEPHVSLFLPSFEVDDYEHLYPTVNFLANRGDEPLEYLNLFELCSVMMHSQVDTRWSGVEYFAYIITRKSDE